MDDVKSTCRSCGAAIIWARINGRLSPFNAKPDEHRGNYLIDGEVAVYATPDQIGKLPSVVPVYLSHFATCPHATHWRGWGRR